MKTLTIRNVPEAVHAQLTAWAEDNHRSLQEQARHLLEMNVKLQAACVMEAAATYRARLAGRKFGNIVEDVRKERAR